MDIFYKNNKVEISSGGTSEVSVYDDGLFFEVVADLDNREAFLEDEKFYNANGQKVTAHLSSSTFGITACLPVEEKIYRLSGRFSANYPVVFLDSEKNFISACSSTKTGNASLDHNAQNVTIPCVYVAPLSLGDKNAINIPSNAKYIGFQSYNSTLFRVESAPVTVYKQNVDKFVGSEVWKTTPLDGKTILFFGDSICTGVGSTYNGKPFGFAEGVQMLAPKSKCYSYAIGGAYFKEKNEATPNRIITQMEKAITEHPEADMIVLEGGFNDAESASLVLSPDWDAFDTSTMWGGMEEAICYLMEHWKDAKILFCTNHWVSSQSLQAGKTFIEGIKAVCQKWAIPVNDNYFASGYQTRKMSGVALHPPYWYHRDFFAPRNYNALCDLAIRNI